MALAPTAAAATSAIAVPSSLTNYQSSATHISAVSASALTSGSSRGVRSCRGKCAALRATVAVRSGELFGCPLNSKRQCGQGVSRAVRRSCHASVATEDHATFLKEVAVIDPPPLLPALLRVLQAQGQQLVSPSDRRGMVPLVVPLTRDPATGTTTALLRWPTALPGMQMPVVSVLQDGGCVLLARTTDEYIHRALLLEDVEGPKDGHVSIADAAGEEGRRLYTAGTFAESGSKSVEAYLTTKVGMFPEVLERLALGHMERGDQVSALVAGEFYARNHFPGFAHPLTFNTKLLLRANRPTEAKDAARIALKSPWWTLGMPYQEVAELAGYGESFLEYALERLSEQGRKDDIQKGKDPTQVSLDQSAFLLDVAAAEGRWDETREQLASLYREAGLDDMAAFVLAGPR